MYVRWVKGNERGVFAVQTQKKESGGLQGIKYSEELSFRHKTLEECAMVYNGRLNLDGEYDWGTPVGRETWCEKL